MSRSAKHKGHNLRQFVAANLFGFVQSIFPKPFDIVISNCIHVLVGQKESSFYKCHNAVANIDIVMLLALNYS